MSVASDTSYRGKQTEVTSTQSVNDGRSTSTGRRSEPVTWMYSTAGVAVRLFFTCWLIYSLHFTTNIVREIYPALALGDHFSFRVDEYANMHPDLFEKEGYGWHIGNNPGASMVAAIPYTLARPIIDPIVERVNRSRAESGLSEPPAYNSHWPMAQDFYAEAWRRGYDIKFGLAAVVTQSLAMAPSSALAVVVMFFLLRHVFQSDKTAFWLSVLYAFGTPVFFRTGFLNHNLMLGHFAFMGFVTMWNIAGRKRWSTATRYFLGGVAGGTAVLFDYSGVVFLLGLFVYGVVKQWREASFREAFQLGCWYVAGSVGPILLLWFYQWRAFGHPFYPGQHWMPPVEWIDQGYQGYGFPQLELLVMLAFDYRFGLFVTCPLMLLALVSPFFNKGQKQLLPWLELTTMLLSFVGLWVFFSGSNYTRLQFNTGIRYLAPIFPFMFVPATIVLMRLPRAGLYSLVVLSFVISWPLAMYREVEVGPGILNPILHFIVGGFQLPALSTLSRMDPAVYGSFFANGVSAIPLLLLAAAILYGIWSPYWSGLWFKPVTR